jgi:hypothetical protein
MESSTKVKELKDDAILNVKVNKTFYMMVKSALITSFKDINTSSKANAEDFIKNLTSKAYLNLNDKERTFYTLTLLIGEIEKQALENNMFIEKDIDSKSLKDSLDNLTKSNED